MSFVSRVCETTLRQNGYDVARAILKRVVNLIACVGLFIHSFPPICEAATIAITSPNDESVTSGGKNVTVTGVVSNPAPVTVSVKVTFFEYYDLSTSPPKFYQKVYDNITPDRATGVYSQTQTPFTGATWAPNGSLNNLDIGAYRMDTSTSPSKNTAQKNIRIYAS